MFLRSKIKSNSRNNSNKQSAKGGAIKNSTISVSGGDSISAQMLGELQKMNKHMGKMNTALVKGRTIQNRTLEVFALSIKNPESKDIIIDMIEDIKKTK